jgi:N-acetylglutamate synthase-like GNAT family acetyltransferase
MNSVQEWRHGEYLVSTDKRRLDMDVVYGFLSKSYWAKGIPREVVELSIEHSLPFGVYKGEQQVGFARVITDYATFGYIGDVFILEAYRGQGLSKLMMQAVVQHSALQGLRRWMLLTRDAHGLYKKIGFTEPKAPERYMERVLSDVYQNEKS